MKYIIVCCLKLDDLPPALTLLKEISLNNDVLYIGVDDLAIDYDYLLKKNIQYVNIASGIKFLNVKGKRIIDRFCRFSYWKLIKFEYLKCNREILKNYSEHDKVIILHEYTLNYINDSILNFNNLFFMYELPMELFATKSKFKHKLKLVNKIITPEYCRAAIIQACLQLKYLPHILPNKPSEYFDLNFDNRIFNEIKLIFDEAHAKNKLVIIYSGIFLRERKLDTIIQAINELCNKYSLVLIGKESNYLNELLSKYNNIRYLGFIYPPNHLSVLQFADVGICVYVSDNGSINPVFCAPNKIWEYSKYGMPILCNDIPGLKYTVELNNFGYCCNIEQVSEVKKCLLDIYNNYEFLSKNAKKFYNSINISDIIKNIIND